MTKDFGEFEKEFLIPGTLILDLKLITMGLELTLVKGLELLRCSLTGNQSMTLQFLTMVRKMGPQILIKKGGRGDRPTRIVVCLARLSVAFIRHVFRGGPVRYHAHILFQIFVLFPFHV